jgi:cell division protein FtsQ
MFTLLLAAISNKRNGQCRDFVITLRGPENNFFINEKDVEELLAKANNGTILGKAVESFNLNALEQMLEKNTWISNAELYFDNRDVLHITIMEKEPVARVFTVAGNSFYLDNEGERLPLSEKLSARVPVFTGFPEKKALNNKDSVLLNEVSAIAAFINNDPFWRAQVAQVDITPDRKFEMVPVAGNHLVRLGDGTNLSAKFSRLMIFYREILSKTGLNKYKLIDVQYKGQVVASRSTGDPSVDSVQLRKNIEKILKQSMEATADTVVKKLHPVVKLEPDSSFVKNETLPDERLGRTERETISGPGRENSSPSAPEHANGQAVRRTEKKDNKPRQTEKRANNKNEGQKIPKAVMPKKPEMDEYGGYH